MGGGGCSEATVGLCLVPFDLGGDLGDLGDLGDCLTIDLGVEIVGLAFGGLPGEPRGDCLIVLMGDGLFGDLSPFRGDS